MTFNWSHGATDAETTSVAIVPVDQDQSAELATYSQRIYSQHYEYLWLEGGSEWYREKVFGADQLATEIRDPRIAHANGFENAGVSMLPFPLMRAHLRRMLKMRLAL